MNDAGFPTPVLPDLLAAIAPEFGSFAWYAGFLLSPAILAAPIFLIRALRR